MLRRHGGVRTLILVCGLAAAARAQTIKDFVEVEGAKSEFLKGIGIVTGLNGNGDSPKGEVRLRLESFMANVTGLTPQEINARNVALVMVTAELPPFQKIGTKIDVRVSTIADAKSLQGGELQVTYLYRATSRQENEKPVAVASGKLLVEGDVKTGGNPTAATVLQGAIVERELPANFVFTRNRRVEDPKEKGRFIEIPTRFVTLNLKKPDFSMASLIADAINTDSGDVLWPRGVGKPRKMAQASNAGTVHVVIPSERDWMLVTEGKLPYKDWENNPVLFLQQVLSIRVVPRGAERGKVIINDSTKSVTVTGDVRIRPGRHVFGGNKVFVVDDEKSLAEVLDPEQNKSLLAFSRQEIIDAIKAFHQLGLILGEVETR